MATRNFSIFAAAIILFALLCGCGQKDGSADLANGMAEGGGTESAAVGGDAGTGAGTGTGTGAESTAPAGGAYTVYPIVVGEDKAYPLDGILSLPTDAVGKAPAVVLVHGSGPSDMNEDIYGITVFKDIAEYLASNGIAALRYNKRTHTYRDELMRKLGDDMTVYEEVIEDAIAAKQLLADDGRIDADNIYVIGHDLGGMLVPRIVEEGGYAGGVIMAGSLRDILEVIYDQNVYLVGLLGLDDDELGEYVAEVDAAREELFGLSTKYYRDMVANPAEKYLLGTTKPFLVLQGGKDFQMTPEKDFSQYKRIADERPGIELKLYENLNHMFTVSTMEDPMQDDYVPGSHVDAEPLRDIADWIKRVADVR